MQIGQEGGNVKGRRDIALQLSSIYRAVEGLVVASNTSVVRE